MIEHMKNMQKTLSELQQVARKGYLKSPDQWDAYSAIGAVALLMDHDIERQLEKRCINHPRLKELIYALETVGVETPDEVKGLIRDLGSARTKMIFHTRL